MEGPTDTGWDRQRSPGGGTWGLQVPESGKEATAQQLINKHIHYFPSSATAIPSQPINHPLSPGSRWKGGRLRRILDEQHLGEEQFDKELFGGLREAYGQRVIPVVKNRRIDKNQFIIYENGNYAIGFSRQLKKQELGIDPEWGGTRNNHHDHALVVFRRETVGGEWRPFTVLSYVELKMDDTAPKIFYEVQPFGIAIREPELSSDAAAIGQTLTYNLDVWLCMRRWGMPITPVSGVPDVHNNTGAQVPFCIISGYRTPKPGATTTPTGTCRTQCLWGHSLIPHTAGEEFGYTVRGWQRFDYAKKRRHRRRNIKIAALAYATQLLSGLAAGQTLVDQLQGGTQPSTLPLSGCTAPLAGCTYIGSPDRKASLGSTDRVSTSQGDIWSLSVRSNQLAELLSSIPRLKKYPVVSRFILGETVRGFWQPQTHLIVKVSSLAVHNRLLLPAGGSSAGFIKNTQNISLIRKVIVGVHWLDHSTITIMRDLRQENYVPLRVDFYTAAAKLPLLWDAFKEFTKEFMLPLAKSDLFHYDLRLDEEETANILVKTTRVRLRDQTHKLHLYPIDFESVSTTPPLTVDARYSLFNNAAVKGEAYNAVWWQVLLAGYAWTNDGLGGMNWDTNRFFRTMGGPKRVGQGNLSEKDVLHLLEKIQKLIHDCSKAALNAGSTRIEPVGTGPFKTIASGLNY